MIITYLNDLIVYRRKSAYSLSSWWAKVKVGLLQVHYGSTEKICSPNWEICIYNIVYIHSSSSSRREPDTKYTELKKAD